MDSRVVLPGGTAFPSSFEIDLIALGARPASISKRTSEVPPVEGDWQLTFKDDFNGDSIDTPKWNIYTENHWDDRSHFSRENVIVKNGHVRLRFKKKSGRHNDHPDGVLTEFQTGYLGTYDKFRQRYG